MRVLVTGIGGFVGPVLAAELLTHGHTVHGVLRREPGPRLTGQPITLHRLDLLDGGAFERLVGQVAPDAVVHLAGVTFVPVAEADPRAAYRTNVEGTLVVLGALRAAAPRARLVSVGSSDVYGAAEPGDLPIDEETPLRPVTVYGASKAAAEMAAVQWSRAYGLDVVCVRPFNHTGPGQSPTFVCAALARQVAAIEAGRQEPVLRAGNVDAVRDFSDVRDIAAGYVALLERGRTGTVYNLCSGEGTSVSEVIALLRAQARVPMRVHSDPALRRATDVPRLVGSHERATTDTSWRPRIPLTETLEVLLDEWRRRLQKETES